mmetsp:Transcript_113733/g.178957  ORF Transcript_113733/g.178957 Transcript_113733/m.178957 type:complete len:80 (-) Transcript_113733:172-411(-)
MQLHSWERASFVFLSSSLEFVLKWTDVQSENWSGTKKCHRFVGQLAKIEAIQNESAESLLGNVCGCVLDVGCVCILLLQ